MRCFATLLLIAPACVLGFSLTPIAGTYRLAISATEGRALFMAADVDVASPEAAVQEAEPPAKAEADVKAMSERAAADKKAEADAAAEKAAADKKAAAEAAAEKAAADKKAEAEAVAEKATAEAAKAEAAAASEAEAAAAAAVEAELVYRRPSYSVGAAATGVGRGTSATHALEPLAGPGPLW